MSETQSSLYSALSALYFIMVSLLWFILGIPFAVSAVILFVTLQKPRLSALLACSGMALDFLLTCFLAVKYPAETLRQTPLESSVLWIQAGNLSLEFGVLLDGLSLLMLFIVTGVGFLIFLYSISYMKGETGYSRYFASLSLFAFSMLGIVLSNNLLGVFIFWEMVGLSSYLLIGFWFEKPSAAIASKKAFLTTRVGDVGMLIGILLLFGALAERGVLATLNFHSLQAVLPNAGLPVPLLTLIALLLFCGVAGKSAQVPLHVWLPDAMEGPTPVSALIHAATMVAAGVFLLARLFFLFELSPDALRTIAWIGAVTALIPATIALVQDDIKKILAYSTLSQLGYMVMAIGLGNREAGMFHLTTHAFFKALLFLGAGSLIHGMHTQNIWEMRTKSGNIKAMPVTSITFLIGTAALMGLPPLSGFYSKEEILSAASHGPQILFYIALSVVFLTSFYMGRLCTLVFFNQGSKTHGHAHESDKIILLPLIILAVFSVIAGFLPIKSLIESGHHAAHHGPAWLAWVSILIALAGFGASLLLYGKKSNPGTGKSWAHNLLSQKYYFDAFYDALIKLVQENLAAFFDWFERQAVVRFAVNGTASATRLAGRTLTKLQTGAVQSYALAVSLGVTVFLFLLLLRG